QRLARLIGQCSILDDRLWKRLDDGAVELRVGRLVDRRAVVLTLQVEDLNATRRRDLAHVLVSPVAHRIELELQLWVELEPRADLEPSRDDEPHGPVLPAQRPPQREPVL